MRACGYGPRRRHCGVGVLGGEAGVDRGRGGGAGSGGLHDAERYVGGVASHPHPGRCGKPGGVGPDLVADAARVLDDCDAEAVQQRVPGLELGG